MTDLDLNIRGLDALEAELEERQARWASGGEWVVGTAVEYSVYLEYGTSRMDPKPFFRPALNEARWKGIPAFIDDHTRKDPDDITSAAELVKTLALALERRVKEIITIRGLVDTGTLRASVQAVPRTDIGQLPSADEVDPDASATIEVSA